MLNNVSASRSFEMAINGPWIEKPERWSLDFGRDIGAGIPGKKIPQCSKRFTAQVEGVSRSNPIQQRINAFAFHRESVTKKTSRVNGGHYLWNNRREFDGRIP